MERRPFGEADSWLRTHGGAPLMRSIGGVMKAYQCTVRGTSASPRVTFGADRDGVDARISEDMRQRIGRHGEVRDVLEWPYPIRK